MKTEIRGSWKLMLVLAGLPFVAASLQTPEPGDAPTNSNSVATAPAGTNSPALPAVAVNESAPADASNAAVITNVPPASPAMNLSKGVGEVVQLAQSGVDENVLLAYIGSVNSQFNMGSDQILYLNDIGVSSGVIKAMIDRDAAIDAAARAAYAATLPDPNAPAMVVTSLTADYGANPPPAPESPPAMTDYNGQNPGDYVSTDDYAPFYGSLAPYGSWIYLAGYGYCWQPTVCVRDHSWRPYCDRGRWLYSDCGWYWQSDYSWGWAAFHYGRWFRQEGHGWVWAPNRVWGPAWVSWRRSEDHSGWAPLPPSAHFAAGAGFSVGGRAVNGNSDFGVSAKNYVFIPTERMTDYAPNRYAVPSAQRAAIFDHSTIQSGITFQNHRVINQGIDPQMVANASGVVVRRAEIHEMPAAGNNGLRTDHLEKKGGTMMIFRPQLPVSPVHRAGSDRGAASSDGRAVSAIPGQVITLPGRIPAVLATPLGNPSRAPVNPRPVLGAATTSSFTPAVDPASKPRVQVWVRPDDPKRVVPSNATKPETYPPNSLVVIGRRNDNNSQPAALPHMNTASQAFQPVQAAATPGVLLPSRSYQSAQSETRVNQPTASQGYYRETANGWTTTPQQQQPVALPARASGYSQPNYGPARNQQYTPPPAYSAPQARYSEPAPAQTYRSAPAYSPPPSSQSSGGSGGSSAPASSSHSSSSYSSSASSSSSRGR